MQASCVATATVSFASLAIRALGGTKPKAT
jgi:hypothetical protein